MFLTGVDQGKVDCLHRGLLSCFIHQCSGALDYIDHVNLKYAIDLIGILDKGQVDDL